MPYEYSLSMPVYLLRHAQTPILTAFHLASTFLLLTIVHRLIN